jgi:hypothetical protein
MSPTVRLRAAALAASVGLTVLLLAPAASAASIAADYPMDDSPGTTILHDTSGNHNDGRIQGSVTATGSYFHFGGSGWVNVPNSSSLNPGSADLLIHVEVRTSTRPGTGSTDFDLVRKGGSQQYKVELYGASGGGIALCALKGSQSKATLKGRTNLVDGNWHTIECAKTSNRVTLTVDGNVEKSVNATLGSISVSKSLAIGSKYGRDDWTKADLRNIVITVG